MLLAVVPALAAGCGGATKTTTTHSTTVHHSTTAHKDTPSGRYHAGAHCRSNSPAFAYAAQGFICVNGRLRHKSHQTSPPTVHHHSHTTTAAPQGY